MPRRARRLMTSAAEPLGHGCSLVATKRPCFWALTGARLPSDNVRTSLEALGIGHGTRNHGGVASRYASARARWTSEQHRQPIEALRKLKPQLLPRPPDPARHRLRRQRHRHVARRIDGYQPTAATTAGLTAA